MIIYWFVTRNFGIYLPNNILLLDGILKCDCEILYYKRQTDEFPSSLMYNIFNVCLYVIKSS